MTTFITLFVAIQILVGFFAFLAIIYHSQEHNLTGANLQRVKVQRD